MATVSGGYKIAGGGTISVTGTGGTTITVPTNQFYIVSFIKAVGFTASFTLDSSSGIALYAPGANTVAKFDGGGLYLPPGTTYFINSTNASGSISVYYTAFSNV
jgi:hypothetical protein